MFKKITVLLLISIPLTGYTHECEITDSGLWDKSNPEYARVYDHAASLFQCIDTGNPAEYVLQDETACNWFTGKAVNLIYNLDTFVNGDGYYTANEMAFKLYNGDFDGWRNLGPASSQDTLTLAGSLVEQGNPVIAAYNNPGGGHGHVALLMPGGMSRSGNWNLDVPNSANLSLNNVQGAFVGCRLSHAFTSAQKNTTYLFTSP